MHRIRTFVPIALTCALAAWAFVGCDQSTDTNMANDVSSRQQTINLNDAYGGYNTADEKPAFGDPYLMENYGENAENLVVGSDANTTHENHMRRHRYLLVTWGNLRADSTVTTATDWSGSLCVENGVIRPVRTIRFDPRDHLVPTTSRTCVEWVSHTLPHFDGILVALHRMPCDSLATADSLCGDPLKVTFTTGPLTVSFTQDELVNLHKVIQVDDQGNAVAFNSVVREPRDCPSGFLAGQWKHVDGKDYDGIFRGEWMSENGLHAGFVHGVYGQNRHHENVFFGKWINDNGTFHGLMAGTWGRSDMASAATVANADGWFRGLWFSRSLHAVGDVKGVWGDGTGEDGGGFFRGAWSAYCHK